MTGAQRQAIQVLGVERQNGKLRSYACRGSAKAQTVVDVQEVSANHISRSKPSVLDNAFSHTSRQIQDLVEAWAAREFYVCLLPPDSPEINAIERTWEKLKAHLMPRSPWKHSSKPAAHLIVNLRRLGTVVSFPEIR